jgi:hypothetical protein
VRPIVPLSFAEYQGQLLVGTTNGLLSNNMWLGDQKEIGRVLQVNPSAMVLSIDVNGTINSIERTGNETVLRCTIDRDVGELSLVGNKLLSSRLSPPGSFYVITNNTRSFAGGEVLIAVNEVVPVSLVGSPIMIRSAKSRIKIDFGKKVPNGSYVGHTLYTDHGDSYVVESQTETVIVVDREVPVGSITSGDKVFFANKDGTTTIFIKPKLPLAVNSLVGTDIRIVSSLTGDGEEVFRVGSNGMVSIKTNGVAPSKIQRGDRVLVERLHLLPKPGHNNWATTNDEDHYHELEFLGLLGGDVDGVESTQSTVVVSSGFGLGNSLLVANPSILAGAEIVFYHDSMPDHVFFRRIVSTTSNSIVVELGDLADWDFDSRLAPVISEGYKWSIDASAYGVAAAPVFVDFATGVHLLAADAAPGDTSITVVSAVGISEGARIRIQGGGSSQNAIVTAVDGETLSINGEVSFRFRTNDQASVIVLSNDVPSGSHYHFVRKGEIEQANVVGFLTFGYNAWHSHGVRHRCATVSHIINSDGLHTVALAGSGGKVWGYKDDKWSVLADVSYLTRQACNVTVMKEEQGSVVIGSSSGFVVFCDSESASEVVLENPLLTGFAPSSSSESEMSSASSASTSSSESSRSSLSSSSRSSSSSPSSLKSESSFSSSRSSRSSKSSLSSQSSNSSSDSSGSSDSSSSSSP